MDHIPNSEPEVDRKSWHLIILLMFLWMEDFIPESGGLHDPEVLCLSEYRLEWIGFCYSLMEGGKKIHSQFPRVRSDFADSPFAIATFFFLF